MEWANHLGAKVRLEIFQLNLGDHKALVDVVRAFIINNMGCIYHFQSPWYFILEMTLVLILFLFILLILIVAVVEFDRVKVRLHLILVSLHF